MADASNVGDTVTATGGQSIIRSAQLAAFKGQLVIPDSVRRIVKMVSFSEENGKATANSSSLFEGSEFFKK